MVRYCCVPNCKGKYGTGVSFHAFPNDKHMEKTWIIKLRIGKKVTKSMRVCSKHFLQEDYLQLDGYKYRRVKLKKSAIPSENLPKASFQQSPNKTAKYERQQRKNRREAVRNVMANAAREKVVTSANNSDNMEISESEREFPILDTDNDVHAITITSDTKMAVLKSSIAEKEEEIAVLKALLNMKNKEIEFLRSEVRVKNEECEGLHAKLEKQDQKITAITASLSAIKSRNVCLLLDLKNYKLKFWKLTHINTRMLNKIFCIENLKKDDAMMNYYTGMSGYAQFTVILNYLVPNKDVTQINYCALSPKYLPLEGQFLVVLTKLRQNYGYKDFAFRLGKSASGISRLFKIWINFMYLRLGSLSLWPHRDVLIANSPKDFLTTFPNVMVVIDSTELYVQKARDLRLQSQTYSTYKGSNTLKGLIGVDQCGGIIFISQLMDGSISDREIFKESGLSFVIEDKIKRGELLVSDEIMADKGFTIQDLLANTSVVIPPFALIIHQMSEGDVRTTKNIARFRVHVERAMARIKKFKILSETIPISIFGSVNQIWTVSCFLANLNVPLLSE